MGLFFSTFISGHSTKYGCYGCKWFASVRTTFIRMDLIFFLHVLMDAVIACQLNLFNRLMNAIDLIRNWMFVSIVKASHCHAEISVLRSIDQPTRLNEAANHSQMCPKWNFKEWREKKKRITSKLMDLYYVSANGI